MPIMGHPKEHDIQKERKKKLKQENEEERQQQQPPGQQEHTEAAGPSSASHMLLDPRSNNGFYVPMIVAPPPAVAPFSAGAVAPGFASSSVALPPPYFTRIGGSPQAAGTVMTNSSRHAADSGALLRIPPPILNLQQQPRHMMITSTSQEEPPNASLASSSRLLHARHHPPSAILAGGGVSRPQASSSAVSSMNTRTKQQPASDTAVAERLPPSSLVDKLRLLTQNGAPAVPQGDQLPVAAELLEDAETMPLFLETNQPKLRWNPPPAEPRLIPPRLEDLLRHHRQREEQGHWGGSMRSASSKQARNTRTTIDNSSGPPRPPELLHKNDGARTISVSGEARMNLSSAPGGASTGQQSISGAYAGERIQQLASPAKQQEQDKKTNNSAEKVIQEAHHLLKRRPKRKWAGSPQDRAAVPAADRSSSNSSSSFEASTTMIQQERGGTPPTPLCAPAGDKWNERFQELREFKAKMGHCNVPHSYKINAPLARWVKRQRHQYRILMQRYQEQEENQNEKERRQRQNTREVAILESQELLPMSTLVRLTSSGASSTATTNLISSRSPTSSGVTTRSTPAALAAPISSLTPERIEALQDLGFVWDVYRDCWQDKIGELRAYKEKHSNCDVPCRYAENPQLAIWVKCQRRQYKLYTEGRPSSITLERIRELEQMGFCWGMRTYKNRGGGGSSLSSQSRDA